MLAQATLKWKARCARGDPRRFLASAVEGMEFSKQGQEVIDRLNLAMDEVEKEAGPPTAANKKAAEMLKKKLRVRCSVRTRCWQCCKMQHNALLATAQPCAAGQNALQQPACRRSSRTSTSLAKSARRRPSWRW